MLISKEITYPELFDFFKEYLDMSSFEELSKKYSNKKLLQSCFKAISYLFNDDYVRKELNLHFKRIISEQQYLYMKEGII